MILLDLLTDTRYGFGNHITDSTLDLFSFVNASKFANTLVDDGFGGQEARFSCNVNIQSSGEVFDVINELFCIEFTGKELGKTIQQNASPNTQI